MSTFTLNQDWVSRVTKSNINDMSVISTDRPKAPEQSELREVLNRIAASEAAREMVRRKWFQPESIQDKVAARGAALFDFLFGGGQRKLALAMFKRSRPRADRNVFADITTMAWVAHVTDTALARPSSVKFKVEDLNRNFLAHLTRLSAYEDGPKRVLHAVREIGVNVIIESGLPGMSLDGASMHTKDTGPIVAMTLRYDRLDNFWFTLMHELGHVALHLCEPSDHLFLDVLEGGDMTDEEEVEAEANAFAKDSLVPRDTWLRSDARRLGSGSSVIALAKQLGIHPAIVAGRIRFERKEFRIFNDLVGIGEVRKQIFKE
jgi:HTH-type transcriptional regulator/antitoxin HigA